MVSRKTLKFCRLHAQIGKQLKLFYYSLEDKGQDGFRYQWEGETWINGPLIFSCVNLAFLFLILLCALFFVHLKPSDLCFTFLILSIVLISFRTQAYILFNLKNVIGLLNGLFKVEVEFGKVVFSYVKCANNYAAYQQLVRVCF